jgi:hypothetical protein
MGAVLLLRAVIAARENSRQRNRDRIPEQRESKVPYPVTTFALRRMGYGSPCN